MDKPSFQTWISVQGMGGLMAEQVPRGSLAGEEMGADCQGAITLNEGSRGHTCAWDPALTIQPWLDLPRLPGGKVSISVMTLDFVHSFWAWNNFMYTGGSLLANSSQHHLLTRSFFPCYSQLSFGRTVELEYKMLHVPRAASSASSCTQ